MSEQRETILPEGITREFLDETRDTWQPFYPETLTDDDCIEIIQNVWGVFDVLYAHDLRSVNVKETTSSKE